MPRTPLIGASAPSLLSLFAGVPLLNDSIADDVLVWTRSLIPATPCLEAMRDFFQDEACVQWVRGLNVAAYWLMTGKVAGAAGQQVFVESLEAAYQVAARNAGTPADALDHWWWEASHRVLTYLVEAGRMEYAQPFSEVAAFYAQTAQNGGPEHLLAYGATIVTDMDLSPVRRGKQVGFRERVMDKARRVLGLANGSHAEQTDDGRAGLARIPAAAPSADELIETARVEAGPSLVVLPSVDHLPGSAKSGDGRPGGSVGTTARSEWAPLAGKRLPLVIVPDLARMKRRLIREFPDCERIIDAILAPLAGRAFAYLSPFLLVGAPGSGKSRLGRRIGEELGLAVTVYACAGVSDAAFGGTSRQWSTGRACVPLQSIRGAGAANVLVILDEIARAGTRADNGRLTDAILTFTERQTARAYHDPYLECAVDLSAVSFVATANTVQGLDAALLSRFRVFEMPMPTARSLPVLARAIVAELRIERELDAVWLPDLTPSELEMIGDHWSGGSVRILQQLVEVAVNGRDYGQAN